MKLLLAFYADWLIFLRVFFKYIESNTGLSCLLAAVPILEVKVLVYGAFLSYIETFMLMKLNVYMYIPAISAYILLTNRRCSHTMSSVLLSPLKSLRLGFR